MKRLLIIRSASFQQLDMNIVAIKQQYPEHQICLLTHEHGVKLAEKYKDVDEILVYPYSGAFRSKNKVPNLPSEPFDAVMVLVTNISGAGFSNVLRFALTIPAKRRFVCNMLSEISEVTRGSIYSDIVRNALFTGVAGLFSGLISLIALPFVLLESKRIERKNV